MNLSKEDQEFVKTYDDSKYAKPSVTADMVIFAHSSEEEHLEELLIQRGRPWQISLQGSICTSRRLCKPG